MSEGYGSWRVLKVLLCNCPLFCPLYFTLCLVAWSRLWKAFCPVLVATMVVSAVLVLVLRISATAMGAFAEAAVAASLLLLFCCYLSITTVPLLLLYRYCSVTAVLLLLFRCYYSVTTTIIAAIVLLCLFCLPSGYFPYACFDDRPWSIVGAMSSAWTSKTLQP